MKRVSGVFSVALIAVMASTCAATPPEPATLDVGQVNCHFCRMVVSDQKFAAQLVAPREDAMFFDDLGCLRAFLESKPTLGVGAVAFVADHRTETWVRAEHAVYTRHDGVATPMGSHVIAHETAASRDADPAARGGKPQTLADMFPPDGHPPGAHR